MTYQAVLTGDIVNSTRLPAAREKKLLQQLLQIFQGHKTDFFRGDSFQVLIRDPRAALKLALLGRATAIALQKDDRYPESDLRISIGIGPVSSPVRSLKTAKGEAFILSGRQFDGLAKSNRRLDICSPNSLANEGLNVIADYLNVIFEGMTSKQAEVITALLKGEKQQTVARKLKKTKSTIHQRTTAGRWPEINRLLHRYENILNQIL